jgi:hypothetical protein
LALLLHSRTPDDDVYSAATGPYAVALYSVESKGPVLRSLLNGLPNDDVLSDGQTVSVEGLHLVRPSGWRMTSAAIHPGATYEPGTGVRYVLAAGSAVDSACLAHSVTIPASLPDDLERGYVGGLYDVDVVDCDSGSGLGSNHAYTVSVSVSVARPGIRIYIDMGDHWQAADAGVPTSGDDPATALLRLPARWAILGPPWPPVRLPIITSRE